ncbi:MAG: hypothetical protein LAT56_15235, partial [Wenzhouxiangella sp.]|nr:hypothetical protein [Wenzhouxiangella sp.]
CRPLLNPRPWTPTGNNPLHEVRQTLPTGKAKLQVPQGRGAIINDDCPLRLQMVPKHLAPQLAKTSKDKNCVCPGTSHQAPGLTGKFHQAKQIGATTGLPRKMLAPIRRLNQLLHLPAVNLPKLLWLSDHKNIAPTPKPRLGFNGANQL